MNILAFLLIAGCRALRVEVAGAHRPIVARRGDCHFGEFGSGYLQGLQLLPSTASSATHRPFVNFDHGSTHQEGLLVHPESNFSMCIIEKNGCTTWTTVFKKLVKHNLNIKRHWYGLVPTYWSEAKAEAVFSQRDSTRVVWVREPLERFLSGFLSQCGWSDQYKRICVFHRDKEQEPGFPLSQVMEWFRDGHTDEDLDSHFSPQSWHCELHKRLREYSLVGLMTKANFSRDAACVLERANLGYLNTNGNGKPFFLPPEDPQEEERKQTQILKKFFTKELAYFLMDLYREDYELFKIRRPAWVEEATGEWYDRRPADVDAASLLQWPGRAGALGEDLASQSDEGDLVRLAASAGF